MLIIERTIGRPPKGVKFYFLNRPLHLTADGKVVEETDPAGVTVLGGAGSPISEADKEKYGLDDSHLMPGEDTSAKAPAAEAESAAEAQAEPEAEELKGHLPEDFPGYAALAEAGINTYGQLRKLEDVQAIPGIGPATAEKIAEALETK